MALHGNETGTNVHVAYAWSYADATARLAATGFVAGDVGKLARQLDANSLWMLTDDSPITWAEIGGSGSVAAASDTVSGKVELATTAETTTGTDATRAVTPDGLHDMTSLAGAAWFLDEDAMTTDSATKVPSQQSVKAYVDAQISGGSVPAASDTVAGKVELATTAETTTGTDATRAVTPDGLHDMTSLAGAAWFLDEDTMTSDSATKTASQQSIKAYVDTQVAGAGGYTSENARDDIAAALVAGTGVTITVDDPGNSITIAAAGFGTDYDVRTKRIIQVLTRPNATSVFSLGIAEPDMTGSIANADDVDGPWLRHTTTTTTNNGCGLLPSFAGYTNVRRGWNPEFAIRIRTDTTPYASTRLMIGLASAGGYDASATPNISHALFRYDTSADGTAFWRCISDSGTGTPQATTTSVAVAADTVYFFDIKMGASNVTFYINGTLVATHSTTIPAANTPLGLVARVVNLASTARFLKWSRLAILHD